MVGLEDKLNQPSAGFDGPNRDENTVQTVMSNRGLVLDNNLVQNGSIPPSVQNTLPEDQEIADDEE